MRRLELKVQGGVIVWYVLLTSDLPKEQYSMEANLLSYSLLPQVQMIQLMQVYMETVEIEVWGMLMAEEAVVVMKVYNHLSFHKIAETSFPYHEYV